MKKYFKYYAICWAVALVVFNVIIFTITNATCGLTTLKPSFWVGYIFITLVLIGHLICSILFFKNNNKDKVFLNYSVMRLAYVAVATSLIVGLIAMITPFIPYWVGIVVDVLILGFYIIAITKATAAVEIVQTRGQKIQQETSFIKMLTVDADALKSIANTDETKELTKKVYESIRYSDPMSTSTLNNINNQIQSEFELFTNAVCDNDNELARSTAEEIISLIELRNKKCRALK